MRRKHTTTRRRPHHAKDKSGKSPLDLEEDEDLQALMLKHAKTACLGDEYAKDLSEVP